MTHTRYTGRTQRVREYLATHPKGATLRELVIHVEPGCKPNNMAGTVSTLVAAGKLRSKVVDGYTRYYPTEITLVDRRADANRRSGPKRSKAGKRARAAPRAATPVPRKAAPAVRPMTRVAAVAPFKRPVIDALAGAETIAQYLARGGRIQRLRNGEVSQPLKHITA